MNLNIYMLHNYAYKLYNSHVYDNAFILLNHFLKLLTTTKTIAHNVNAVGYCFLLFNYSEISFPD